MGFNNEKSSTEKGANPLARMSRMSKLPSKMVNAQPGPEAPLVILE